MMEKKRILLVLGHPNNESLCAALARAYEAGALAAGAELRMHRVGEMDFEGALRIGYQGPQHLEPDLQRFQDDLLWCEHLVMVFPLWWGGLPGPMKSLIDRTFLPGLTFKFQEGSQFQTKLLKGRSARVIMTMDTPNWWYNWILGRPLTKALRGQILGFCGLKPLRFTLLGNVRGSTAEKRQGWLRQAERLGQDQI